MTPSRRFEVHLITLKDSGALLQDLVGLRRADAKIKGSSPHVIPFQTEVRECPAVSECLRRHKPLFEGKHMTETEFRVLIAAGMAAGALLCLR